jgi:hypothetical protein
MCCSPPSASPQKSMLSTSMPMAVGSFRFSARGWLRRVSFAAGEDDVRVTLTTFSRWLRRSVGRALVELTRIEYAWRRSSSSKTLLVLLPDAEEAAIGRAAADWL